MLEWMALLCGLHIDIFHIPYRQSLISCKIGARLSVYLTLELDEIDQSESNSSFARLCHELLNNKNL